MKIYATHQDDIDLDWFVGKDYLVLVKLHSDRFNGTPVYARICERQLVSGWGRNYGDYRQTYSYLIRIVTTDLRRYTESVTYSADKIKSMLREGAYGMRGMWVDADEISLVTPVDFITIEEAAYEMSGGRE